MAVFSDNQDVSRIASSENVSEATGLASLERDLSGPSRKGFPDAAQL
jgi:hypothetical protein